VATGRKPRRSGRRRGRARPQAEPEAPPPVIEASSVSQVEDGIEQPLEGLPLSIPEPALAARVPAPEPARPLPSGRRAIFFDVENTSRAEHISRVIAHLALDRVGRRTEFFAVGNWRVIGHDTARLLARQGAALVHSAPSVGVRDWSDLRIAVASGVWLAGARPGDVIEIVSDDRAFDAVGDVAASLGVTFRRLSYRGLLGVPTPEPIEVERVERDYAHADRGGRRRRHRGGRGRREHGAPRPVHHAPAPHAARSEPAAGAEPHTAPHDEIVAVVRDLARARGAALGFEPLEVAVGDLQRAARGAWNQVAVRGRRRDRLDARVDHLVRGLQAVGPRRHESPAQQPRLGLALRSDDREDLFGRRDVEAPGARGRGDRHLEARVQFFDARGVGVATAHESEDRRRTAARAGANPGPRCGARGLGPDMEGPRSERGREDRAGR